MLNNRARGAAILAAASAFCSCAGPDPVSPISAAPPLRPPTFDSGCGPTADVTVYQGGLASLSREEVDTFGDWAWNVTTPYRVSLVSTNVGNGHWSWIDHYSTYSAVLQGISIGHSSVTLDWNGGEISHCWTMYVVADDQPTSIEVGPAISLNPGQTWQLVATPRGQYGEMPGRQVEWQSSDPSHVTISNSGVVTGVAAGGAIISATYLGTTGSVVIGSYGSQTPLSSVTLSGPSTVPGDVSNYVCTWSASVNDGSPPFRYTWYLINQYGMSDVIFDSYNNNFNNGILSYAGAAGNTLKIVVTDANGTSVSASRYINSGGAAFGCQD